MRWSVLLPPAARRRAGGLGRPHAWQRAPVRRGHCDGRGSCRRVARAVASQPDTLHRILLGSTTMNVTLGLRSYGLFIWYLAVLSMVFFVIGAFEVQRQARRWCWC